MSDKPVMIHDIVDKSLLSDKNRMVGSSYVYGLCDLYNPMVSLYIDDYEVTPNEIGAFLLENITDMRGLQNKQIPEYAVKLYGKATFFTVRTKNEGKLIALLATYVNLDTGRSFIPILVVDQRYRSMRLGSRLLLVMEAYVRHLGQQRIRVITSKENKGAQRFYEEHGYQKISQVMNEGRKGIIYEKDLAARGGSTSGTCHCHS